jgi:hypothetical protein
MEGKTGYHSRYTRESFSLGENPSQNADYSNDAEDKQDTANNGKDLLHGCLLLNRRSSLAQHYAASAFIISHSTNTAVTPWKA